MSACVSFWNRAKRSKSPPAFFAYGSQRKRGKEISGSPSAQPGPHAAVLRRAVDSLSPRERQIMELRFGLADGIERTQKEAADALGISQSYISRLEKRIIHTLKVQLENE